MVQPIDLRQRVEEFYREGQLDQKRHHHTQEAFLESFENTLAEGHVHKGAVGVLTDAFPPVLVRVVVGDVQDRSVAWFRLRRVHLLRLTELGRLRRTTVTA